MEAHPLFHKKEKVRRITGKKQTKKERKRKDKEMMKKLKEKEVLTSKCV